MITLLAAYLGYRRWGGARGALRAVLILWAVYAVVTTIIVAFLMLSGDRVQSILDAVASPLP